MRAMAVAEPVEVGARFTNPDLHWPGMHISCLLSCMQITADVMLTTSIAVG